VYHSTKAQASLMGPKFTKPAIPNSEDEVSSTSGREKHI